MARTNSKAEQLQFVDNARARHLASSARTRVDGADAGAELARHHQDDPTPPERVTADEWLAAHQAAAAEDDEQRPITDADARDADQRADEPAEDRAARDQDGRRADRVDQLEIPEPDVREVAAAGPASSDRVRVAAPEETAEWTRGAYRALAEVDAREVHDAQHEEEERAAQLARWHDDPIDDDTRGVDQGDYHGDRWADDGPTLNREPEPAGTR